MNFNVSFKVNSSIYLRDPESSELGRKIVKCSIDLIYKLGFEHFTFKKLAAEVQTTEATVYRYFENKHRVLLYILNWYWSYLEFSVIFKLQNMKASKTKLKAIVHLLTHNLPENEGNIIYNNEYLSQIVIAESSKVYLVKEIKEINRHEAFKPYKDLCAKIAEVISDYNPDYRYPRSLSSTLIETAHQQQYFSTFLPRLTDSDSNNKQYTTAFLENMLFKILG